MTGKVLPEYKPFIITPFWGFLLNPISIPYCKRSYTAEAADRKGKCGFGHPESLQFLSEQG